MLRVLGCCFPDMSRRHCLAADGLGLCFLSFFLPHLFWRSQSLGSRRWIIAASVGMVPRGYLFVFCPLVTSVLDSICCKNELFWWRMRAIFICGLKYSKILYCYLKFSKRFSFRVYDFSRQGHQARHEFLPTEWAFSTVSQLLVASKSRALLLYHWWD